MAISYQYSEKRLMKVLKNCQKYVNFQTEQGGVLGQPD